MPRPYAAFQRIRTADHLMVFMVVGAFAFVGAIFLVRSNAATSFASVEAESGSVTAPAAAVSDTTASGGRAVRFTPAAVPPVPGALTNTPSQSAAIVYGGTYTNVSAYAKPGGFVVAGRDNYQNQVFKDVSDGGGTVLIYLDPIIDNNYGRYHGLMLNASECGAAVPRWPGSPQANEWGYLADFRPGSILQGKLECVLEKMVAENPHMAGWFADDLGSRSWFPLIDWGGFGAANQQAYRDGAVALTQTFRRVADRHGLIFMVNGTWGAGSVASSGGGYPDLNQHGNALADGAFVENHLADEIAYWKAYGCSRQWASQSTVTRGVAFHYAVTRAIVDRDAFRNAGCYAFAAAQADYGIAPAPYSALHPTGLPGKVTR